LKALLSDFSISPAIPGCLVAFSSRQVNFPFSASRIAAISASAIFCGTPPG